MNITLKIISSFISFISSYLFIYWAPFSLIPEVSEIAYLPQIVSLILSIIISIYVWFLLGKVSNGLAKYVITGAILTGAISFSLGFFIPLILSFLFNSSDGNGPLLGFFLGPVGFLTGAIGGGIYWKIKKAY